MLTSLTRAASEFQRGRENEGPWLWRDALVSSGMKQVIVAMVAAAAGLSWLLFFVSGIAMIRHRAPGVTVLYLMTHGTAFFGGSHFTQGAAPHRFRFLLGFGVFFLCILALAVITFAFRPPAART
jgi:hypothetical protein